jgi:hypothetical protein
MKCDKCQADIAAGDEREHLGSKLCEDCYMDALSPMKTCDPWAVHSAKSFDKHMGAVNTVLNPIQTEMVAILAQTGGLEPKDLLIRIGGKVSEEQMQREFAALRHMEKVRAEKRGERVFWRLW